MMASITAITPTAKDPKRVQLRVDGRPVAQLPAKVVQAMGLAEGAVWHEDLAEQVAQAVALDKAQRDAMRRMNRRMLAASVLRTKLLQRGHEPDVAAKVVDRLTDLGVVDDRALGQALIREMTDRQPAGATMLLAKLTQRGLAPDLAQELVDAWAADQAQADTTPVDQALQFAEKRLATMQHLAADVQRRRLWGALARRGFDEETVEQAVGQLLPNADDD